LDSSNEELMRRIRNDLIDSYDEELEMELEDRTVAELTGEGRRPQPAGTVPRTRNTAASISASCSACRPSW
jgi:hypothetical protein